MGKLMPSLFQRLHTSSICYIIRSIGYDGITSILSIIFRIVPKNNRRIIFFSTPDYADNSRYLYEEMIKQGVDKRYDLIWAVHSEIQCNYVIRRTLRYLWVVATARYIVSTHETPKWKASNQIAILLWHGIPLKNMGYYLSTQYQGRLMKYVTRIHLYLLSKKTNYFVVSSMLEKELYSSAFQILPEKFIICGQPRCDVLYYSNQNIPELFQKMDIPWNPDHKYLLYLPTFRDYGSCACQGIIKDLLDNPNLKDYLKQNNLVLLIKPHINDEKTISNYISNNVHILSDYNFRSNNLSIYDIFKEIAILITDYSSVYFDYLLLNKPIIYYVPDINIYRIQRGFLLEPFEEWTPGDKARTCEELIIALGNNLANPQKWEMERLRLKKIVSQYDDGKSSERIITEFFK